MGEELGKKTFVYIVLDPKRKGREIDKSILDSTEKDTHYDETELDYGFMTRAGQGEGHGHTEVFNA